MVRSTEIGRNLLFAFILSVFILPVANAGLVEIYINDSDELTESETEFVIEEGVNLDLIIQLDKELEEILKHNNYSIENTRSTVIDVDVLKHQIPGGMYSYLISQLSELQAIEKLDDVLNEIPRTRADLGFPPLVTPISQMVGSQSVNNVLFGRYQMITDQVKDFIAGKYGRPPAAEVVHSLETPADNPDLVLNLPDEKPSSRLKPEMQNAKKQIIDISSDIKDVLTYVLYPAIALDFLKSKFGLSSFNENRIPQ